jgi:putative ABC transport system permease protein
VALAERERELATLRVIGFTRGEVSRVLLGELWTLVIAALPLGCGIGYAMISRLAAASGTDLFRLPVVVGRGTWLFATSVVVATAVAVSVSLRRRLDRLDFASVLKTKE